MRDFWIVYRAEWIKLRRTLALWMMGLGPAVVVTLQIFLWLRNKDGFSVDVDLWLSFAMNSLSMWSLFMQPMLAALIAALVFQVEHANAGWLRLYSWPVQRWAVPAAKLAMLLSLLGGSTLLLALGCVGGTRLADLLHPAIDLQIPIPWGTLFFRTLKVFLASLGVVGLQALVSFRWPSMTLSLGVGITGTFIGLFAAGSRFGRHYPWLLALNTLHGKEEVVARCVALGAAVGAVLLTATLVYAVRRDPGRYA